MAWETPADWSYKEAPGSEKLNTQIRDNLNYLKSSLPPGVILDYGGSTAPDQWLLCNGAAVSRTTYAALFAIIGVTYGVGDNSTTFNVPDFRGRVAVGAGQGSGLTNRVLATIFGTETHTLSEAEMPVHTHTQNAHAHAFLFGGAGEGRPGSADGSSFSINTESTTATNQNSGGGVAHANTQPSLVATKIIKF